MSRCAELAHDLDAHAEQPDPARDLTIARVAERLSILGHSQESAELAQLAYDLRQLIAPPVCRWCGKPLSLNAAIRHHVLGSDYCSRACVDEALLIPDPTDPE